MAETLLLTGTIAPNNAVTKQGYHSASLHPEKRLSDYLNALIFYISQSRFDNIVFCENSNYKIPEESLKIMKDTSKFYNKELEILQFQGDHKMLEKLGYNYGEGECIDYAFDNSELLKKSKNRYKITGRYIYYNINQIIKNFETKEYGFYRFGRLFPFGISTAIFKCNNDFYLTYLYDLKKHTDFKKGKNLEQLYYHRLRSPLIKSKYSLRKQLMPLYNLLHEGKPLDRNIYFDACIFLFSFNKLFLDFGGVFDMLLHNILYKLLRARKYSDL